MKPSRMLTFTFAFCFATATLMAADSPSPLTQAPFNVESAVAAAAQSKPGNSFTGEAAKTSHVSKTKIAIIAAAVGAAVVGIIIAKQSLKGGGSSSPSMPAGTGGSVVLINGVPQ